MRRLSALQWAEFLKAQNVRPGQYHREIALAFGADWDAIRKWRNSSIALFGEDYVRTLLSDAREGFGLRFSFPDYRVSLHGYGASYRALAGLGSIDPDAFEAALGTSAK